MKPEDKKLEEWLNSEQEHNLREYMKKASEISSIYSPGVVVDWFVCNKENVSVDEPVHAWGALSTHNEMYINPEILHNRKFTETIVHEEYLHERLKKKLKQRFITKIISFIRKSMKPYEDWKIIDKPWSFLRKLKNQYEEMKVADELLLLRPDLRPVIFSIYGFKYLATESKIEF